MIVKRIEDRKRASKKSSVSSWMVLASGCALTSACIDTQPITMYKDAGEPVEASDAPLGEVSDPKPACRACIAAPNVPGPGCEKELARCYANEGCHTIYECAYRTGCVFKSEYEQSLVCALPCADGILNAFQEPIMAAIALTMCFHAECSDVCAEQAPPQ